MQKFARSFALAGLVACLVLAQLARAQDYDDDGYGGQGGQNGEGDNYANQGANQGYGNDDGYNANPPHYQQNVDSDSSNNQPSSESHSPQGSSDADGDYEGDDNSAAASNEAPSYMRVKRSLPDSEPSLEAAKLRVKRHSKYIGPVYTYVKTDKHANFKWGVKHKVGKKHYG